MLYSIRVAMHDGTLSKMSGTCEADKTFVGGQAKNMHKLARATRIKGRDAVGKAIVQGVLQRGDRVIVGVVDNTKRKTLMPNIRSVVEKGSTVYSDALKSYEGLASDYVHETVDHAREYVRGDVYTNGMENFWSLLKEESTGRTSALCRGSRSGTSMSRSSDSTSGRSRTVSGSMK